jgi:hypothetical protein
MSTKIDPDAAEAAHGVKQALLELRIYASSHVVDDALGKSADALVAAGALSPQTAAFIANHHARFYGCPSGIGQHTPVLDIVLADRATPLRLVGFADGHVELVAVGKQV